MKKNCFALALFWSIEVYAGAEWTGKLPIEDLQLHYDYFQVTSPSPLTLVDEDRFSECSGTARKINISRTSPIYNEGLSVVLAAKLANVDLNFYVTGCVNANVLNGAFIKFENDQLN